MKKLSIGSWAYCFGPYEKDPVDFRTVITKLGELGMDGVEFGAFAPHPNPDSHNTIAQRQELKDMVRQSGLEFSALPKTDRILASSRKTSFSQKISALMSFVLIAWNRRMSLRKPGWIRNWDVSA